MDYDVWYTLPWAFEPFFDLSQPTQYITKTKVFALPPSYTSTVSPSRLRTLHISENKLLPSMISMPHVVRFDRIETVHLSFHDWPIGLNLPALRHVTLTNNLVALKTFASFPPSIRSIQILFHPRMPNFVSTNWSVLRSLSALPMLTSLHIVFENINTGLDELSCQIIAETVPMLVHFGIYFRSKSGIPTSDDEDEAQNVQFDLAEFGFDADELENLIVEDDDDDLELLESLCNMYRTSIKELHRCILCSPFRSEPLIVVEEEGYGLTVWT